MPLRDEKGGMASFVFSLFFHAFTLYTSLEEIGALQAKARTAILRHQPFYLTCPDSKHPILFCTIIESSLTQFSILYSNMSRARMLRLRHRKKMKQAGCHCLSLNGLDVCVVCTVLTKARFMRIAQYVVYLK